jgi:hypothetical protein
VQAFRGGEVEVSQGVIDVADVAAGVRRDDVLGLAPQLFASQDPSALVVGQRL